MNCIARVIHVPGITIIVQGSIGLSRGVHMQSLASRCSNTLVPLLWRPASHSPSLLQYVLSKIPPLWHDPISKLYICYHIQTIPLVENL